MFKHCKEYYLNNIASFVQIDFVDLSALGLRYRSLKLLIVEGGLNILACQPLWWNGRKCLIAFPDTNFMGTTLLLSFLTTGDVHDYLRFCFWLFISKMPISVVEIILIMVIVEGTI